MKDKESNVIIAVIILANLLWYLVFKTSVSSFWLRLLVAIVVLNLVAFRYQSYVFDFNLLNCSRGLISAVILYFIFWVGKYCSEFLFNWSHAQIMSVYALKSEVDYKFVLLVLVIAGIGEELFWRGFLQQKLSQNLGARLGYISTSLIYGAVHIWTGNVMLVLAALTAGLFWGYLFLRTKSLSAVIISHGVWDLLIFLIFPLDF